MIDKEVVNKERRVRDGLCPIPDYEIIVKRKPHQTPLGLILFSFVLGVIVTATMTILSIVLK